MKVGFLYTWTKNKDKQDEYMKSLGGNLRLPSFLRFFFFFLKSKRRPKIEDQ